MLSFLDDFEEAKKIKEKRRKIIPGTYNTARLNEHPLPLLVLVNNNDQLQLGNDEEVPIEKNPLNHSLDSACDGEAAMANKDGQFDELQDFCANLSNETNELNVATGSPINNQIQIATEEQFNEISSSQSNDGVQQSRGSIADETAPNPLIISNDATNNEVGDNQEQPSDVTQQNDGILMNGNDQSHGERAYAPLADDISTQSTTPSNSANETANGSEPPTNAPAESVVDAMTATLNADNAQSVKVEPLFTPLVGENEGALDDLLNNSYEACDKSGDVLICTSDNVPRPMALRNQYEVKINDSVSGNMAYAPNVSTLLHIEQSFCYFHFYESSKTNECFFRTLVTDRLSYCEALNGNSYVCQIVSSED